MPRPFFCSIAHVHDSAGLGYCSCSGPNSCGESNPLLVISQTLNTPSLRQLPDTDHTGHTGNFPTRNTPIQHTDRMFESNCHLTAPSKTGTSVHGKHLQQVLVRSPFGVCTHDGRHVLQHGSQRLPRIIFRLEAHPADTNKEVAVLEPMLQNL